MKSTSTGERRGFELVSTQFEISAPDASVTRPLRLVFELDASAVAAGEPVVVWRDDDQTGACAGGAGATSASPDPCVASDEVVDGVRRITLLSSHASTWQLGVPAPGSIEAACTPGTVPGGGFGDVAAGNVHRGAIDCVAWFGIAQGTATGRFSPDLTMTRGQMASFVARLLAASGVTLPDVTLGQSFRDVAAGHPHAGTIEQLAELGVARGRRDGTFGPGAPVTRAEMATFLVRAYELVVGSPLPDPAGAGPFTDTDGLVHEVNIDKLAAAGIALGVGDGAFDPNGAVRRDQMASLLARTISRLAAAGQPVALPRTLVRRIAW